MVLRGKVLCEYIAAVIRRFIVTIGQLPSETECKESDALDKKRAATAAPHLIDAKPSQDTR